jgi:hypothetical protein
LREDHKLQLFEKTVFRKILGLVKDGCIEKFRILHNEEQFSLILLGYQIPGGYDELSI